MGRGRAKAKQTKVARDLKYKPQETDLDALQRELRSTSGSGRAEEYDERDDESWASRRR